VRGEVGLGLQGSVDEAGRELRVPDEIHASMLRASAGGAGSARRICSDVGARGGHSVAFQGLRRSREGILTAAEDGSV
jgi:hypothetical protein